MEDDYDLVVVGAGMAGISAANKCASGGWRVAGSTAGHAATGALLGSSR
jgi:succinate dehydrogenase/fumarate reductase flavoprotein subunit